MAKRTSANKVSADDRKAFLEQSFSYIPKVGHIISFPDTALATAVEVLQFEGITYATIKAQVNGKTLNLPASTFFWERRALRCGALASGTDLNGTQIEGEDTNEKTLENPLSAMTRGEQFEELLKLGKIEVRKTVLLKLSHEDDEGNTIFEDAKIFAYFK